MTTQGVPISLLHSSPDRCGKRIGILIVAYNAVTTLASVLRRIPRDVWENVEEVVVMDDASPDDTYELAVGYKAITGVDKLNVLKHPTNLGYGGNQKAGYEYLMAKGMDVVVLLHGDGQYAPEILADLYAPIVSGDADAVFGSRMLPDYGGALRGRMPLYKFFGNKILTAFENASLGMSLSEFHSGYRAYSLDFLRKIDFSSMTDDFHFDTEIIIKVNHLNGRIVEVPIPTYYGDEICYVNGLKYAADVFGSVLRYRRTVAGASPAPEFSEFFPHYPLKNASHSSHDYIKACVGANKDVLDVGCGQGYLARELANAGNRVTGVDLLDHPECQGNMVDYVSIDLDRNIEELIVKLSGREFDVILLPDVLEHLRHPEWLLNSASKFLRPGGRIIVSLPNVANIVIRLSLLFGRFEYSERGILDRTHVRFFTYASGKRLIESAGLAVLESYATVMPVGLALGVSAENGAMRRLNAILVNATKLFPRILGYQSLYVCQSRSQ